VLDFLKKYQDRIYKSKIKIKKCYKNNELQEPPILFYLSPFYLIKSEKIDAENYFKNPYSALEIQLKSIEERLDVIEDDYIPYLFPYWGVCTLASGFGGKVHFYRDKDPLLEERVIKDIKDIDGITKPDPEKSGLMKTVFDLIKIWKKEVKNNIPIGITDIQGPISISMDLLGVENFFFGIIDFPKKIHRLLEIVTEYLIDCLKFSYSIIGDREDGYFVSGVYIPNGFGKVRISEDNISFISPEICRKFLNPYLEMIFYEIGNDSVHWCGDGFKNINEILKIKGLKGINNCSIGDIDIIEKQSEIVVKNNIIYYNEVCMPTFEWFGKVKQVTLRKNILHHFSLTSEDFGMSFNGYEKINLGNKFDYMKKLLKINLE